MAEAAGERPERVWALIIQGMQNEGAHPAGVLHNPKMAEMLDRHGAIANIIELADAVRRSGGVVVHALFVIEDEAKGMPTNAAQFRRFIDSGGMRRNGWGVQPLPAVHTPTDLLIEKMRVNPFYGSTLQPLLEGLQVSHVISCGTQTNMGVEAAARHAADAGYEVFVPSDATAAITEDAHRGPLTYTLPNLATVGTTEQIRGFITSSRPTA